MSYYVRLMSIEDIAQVTEIDREAFTTQWPPPDYKNELRNQLAHYVVACDEEKTIKQPEVEALSEKSLPGLASRLRRLFNRSRSFNSELPSPSRHCIIGFVGFWIMAGEAHITSIAVREEYRRQGIGELLLISAIDLAAELKARSITLEGRDSNALAQSLYFKYGFSRVGIRRGYYIDNREDGVLMSTDDIDSASFQVRFQQLKQALSRRLGIPRFHIIR